jgi:peptide deformylase
MTESESPIDIERIEEIREQYVEADSQEQRRQLENELLAAVLWTEMEPGNLSRYIDSLSEEERQSLSKETEDELVKMVLRAKYFEKMDFWE